MTRHATPADYARLGVATTASADEVRSAYRRLALLHHPDRNPDDPEAGRRFSLLTESYTAITEGGPPPAATTTRPRPGRPRTGFSPAPAAVPRRPHPRPRPAERGPVPISSLPIGDTGWVDVDTLLVAPDSSCYLDPGALAQPHATHAFPIRVVHLSDGFHAGIPAEGRHRWSPSARASAIGLQVVTLGIDSLGQPSIGRNPLMPAEWLSSTVSSMVDGQRGWVVPAALVVEPSGRCWIDGSQPLSGEPTMTNTVRVECHDTGIYVFAAGRPEAWAQRELPVSHTHLELTGATLGGVALHRRAPASPWATHHR